MDQFRVLVVGEGAALVLRIAGELDMATVGILQSALEGVGGDTAEVIVDVADLTFIDSSGISELVRFRGRLGDGGSVLLRSASGGVRRTLEIAGLGQMLADPIADPAA